MCVANLFKISVLQKLICDYVGPFDDLDWYASMLSLDKEDPAEIDTLLQLPVRFTTHAICAMANHHQMEWAYAVLAKQCSEFKDSDIEVILEWTCVFRHLFFLQHMDWTKWIPALTRKVFDIMCVMESCLHHFLTTCAEKNWIIVNVMSESQFLAFAINLQKTSDIIFFADHQEWIDETHNNVVIQVLMCVSALNNDYEAMTYLVSRFETIVIFDKDKTATVFFEFLLRYFLTSERIYSMRLLLSFWPGTLVMNRDSIYGSHSMQRYSMGFVLEDSSNIKTHTFSTKKHKLTFQRPELYFSEKHKIVCFKCSFF